MIITNFDANGGGSWIVNPELPTDSHGSLIVAYKGQTPYGAAIVQSNNKVVIEVPAHGKYSVYFVNDSMSRDTYIGKFEATHSHGLLTTPCMESTTEVRAKAFSDLTDTEYAQIANDLYYEYISPDDLPWKVGDTRIVYQTDKNKTPQEWVILDKGSNTKFKYAGTNRQVKFVVGQKESYYSFGNRGYRNFILQKNDDYGIIWNLPWIFFKSFKQVLYPAYFANNYRYYTGDEDISGTTHVVDRSHILRITLPSYYEVNGVTHLGDPKDTVKPEEQNDSQFEYYKDPDHRASHADYVNDSDSSGIRYNAWQLRDEGSDFSGQDYGTAVECKSKDPNIFSVYYSSSTSLRQRIFGCI